MARLRYNGLSAALGGSLTNSATSITFAAGLTHSNGTNVPTITGADYIPLAILDSSGHLSEVVWLTAYTAAATTGTIARGKEGTSGVTHASGDKVVCAILGMDLNYAGVKAYRSAAYSMAASTATALPWDAEEWDTDTFHDTSTNNTRLTVPSGLGGKYLVSATIATSATLAGRLIVSARKNGTDIRGGNGEASIGTTNSFPAVNIACEVDLAVGDYVEIIYYQDTAGTRAVDLNKSGVSMHRIG